MHVVEYRKAGCEKWDVKVYPSAREAAELRRLLHKAGFQVETHSTFEPTGLKGARVA